MKEPSLVQDLERAPRELREGRFERGLSLVAAGSSVLAGLEVSYEHYKGSYGQRVMWTPVILSAAMTGVGAWAYVKPDGGRRLLRITSAVTLVDSLVGFGFHIRGIARKPGGWRLPLTNIIMGPPIFAPLLFGVSAYLGFIASYERPEGDVAGADMPAHTSSNALEISFGEYQKHLCVATAASAFLSGFEALYSHYKNNFRFKAQWTPVVLAPALMVAAIWAIKSPRAARTALPVLSAAAVINGGIGFYYHARGVVRRPGGLKKAFYNVTYGPPIFAPLLFAACGALGLLAFAMRREPGKP